MKRNVLDSPTHRQKLVQFWIDLYSVIGNQLQFYPFEEADRSNGIGAKQIAVVASKKKIKNLKFIDNTQRIFTQHLQRDWPHFDSQCILRMYIRIVTCNK